MLFHFCTQKFLAMKLKLLYTLTLTLLTAFVFAQNTETAIVKGTVTSTEGKPLEQAVVTIKNTAYGTVTDAKGNFSIKVKPGTYIVVVKLMGAEGKETTVTAKANEEVSITTVLDAKLIHHRLDDVVVTGQFAPQSVRNSVYKVRTISQETIKMRGATDVTGVLNNELGIRFAPDNTLGESDMKIFGVGGSRVKVLLDGVPLIDRDPNSKQSLTQIDINTIDRIEIVEGPMSVVYGTDAIAGVINIITKKGVKAGNNLSVAVRVQEESVADTYSLFTNDGIHNENVSVNWNNSHWNVSGYATRNNFSGYADTAEFPAKVFKPKDQWLGGGSIGYRNHKLSTWYRLDYANEEVLSAGQIIVSSQSLNSFQQYYKTNRYTHQAQLDWQVSGRFKLNTAASYQDYERQTESYIKDYKNNTQRVATGEGYWDVSKFKTYFLRTTGVWTINDQLTLQPGFDIKNDEGSGARIDGKKNITDYAVFASAEYKPTARINIRPGVRFSKNSVYDAPPVIPSLNTKFTLSKNFDLRVSYARGFRAPSLRELYFKFVDANHNVYGNPDLKAETSHSFNASLGWQNTGLSTVNIRSTFTAFYNTFKNQIDFAYLSGTEAVYMNVARYKNMGGTLENNFAWKRLNATVGVSYIAYYNQLQDDATLTGNKTKFSWAPEANANLTYQFPKLKANIGLYYKYTGKVPTYTYGTGNDIVLAKREAFHWADFTASKHLFKYFALQAGVKNILDVNRLNSTNAATGVHSGTTNIYAYGRSYFVGINFQWSQSRK